MTGATLPGLPGWAELLGEYQSRKDAAERPELGRCRRRPGLAGRAILRIMTAPRHHDRGNRVGAPIFSLADDAALPFSAVPKPDLESSEQARGLHAGTWTSPTPLVLVRNSDTTRPSHFFRGGYSSLRLVSGAVVDALTAVRATGWGTYPIVLLDEDGSSLGDDHVGLVVRGRCGPLLPLHPHIVEESVGVRIDEADWDGSDVFSPAGSSAVLLTDRTRRAVAHLEGLWFVPFDEVPYFPPRTA